METKQLSFNICLKVVKTYQNKKNTKKAKELKETLDNKE